MALEIFPAVDIVNGQAMRLVKGEAGTETGYGCPLKAAREFAEQGAKWLHVVDLDAAFGRGSNADIVERIVREVELNVEICGGVRDQRSLERAINTGATRVNIGTAAIEKPDWVAAVISEYGDKISIGLDVRGRTVATHGWTSDADDLYHAIEHLDAAGAARYVVTDVHKDGTLTGPNLDLLAKVCASTKAAVIASGGISELSDVAALKTLPAPGVEGVIIGKALYAGKFTLPEALQLS